MDVFLWVANIFRVALKIFCACWGGDSDFPVVVACLSVTVLNSDSTRFPPPLLQPLLMGNGQCGGKVFASRGWWEALGKAGHQGFRKSCYISN